MAAGADLSRGSPGRILRTASILAVFCSSHNCCVSSRCCCVLISVFWDVRSGPTVRQHPGFDQQPSTWSECCRASCQMAFWGKNRPPLTGLPQGQRDTCSSRAKGILKNKQKGLLLKKNIEPVLQLRAFQSPWLWVQFLVLYKDLSITV